MKCNRYLIKKSVAQIQAEAGKLSLKRTLGPWNLISLGIGCIIGAGIFVMTGSAAANYAGPAIMLSFIFTGIACAFVGLCYAELASVLPISGSAYTYTYATLGEALAWIMGWLLVLEYGVAASTVAVGWSGYINSFLLSFGVMIPPELTSAPGEIISVTANYRHLFEAAGYAFNANGNMLDNAGNVIVGLFNLPAFIGITMVTALLVIGISESAKVNNIIVAIKLTVVLMFIVIGAMYINPDNWHPFIPENTAPGKYGWDGVFRAASIIFFAYVGFEAVSTAAQEAKDPQKDMPFGILGSLFVCTALYIAVSAVLTGIVPYTELSVPDPMAVAVDKIGLSWFAFLIKIGAITGLTSVMLVLLYGQTRIFYIMGRDGLLPDFFCKVHPKLHTPYINTVVVGLIVAVAAALTPISLLGDLVSLGTLCAFMMVCFSVLYLRKKQPDLPRPFRTPFMPVTPILGMLTCGYLVYSIFFGTLQLDEQYYAQQYPDVSAAIEAGSYKSPFEHYKEVGQNEGRTAINPAAPDQAKTHIVLTHSGEDVLHYTGPYMIFGILVYLLYGQFHSKLRRGQPPYPGDPEFVQEPHEPQVD